SPSDPEVRRVYLRREFENIWLRTKRYNASGKVVSGTGGVCYLYWPAHVSAAQRRALARWGFGCDTRRPRGSDQRLSLRAASTGTLKWHPGGPSTARRPSEFP
ncbi:hypothetical protein ACFH04_05640, partial [Streptomyces noboritoensis]